MKHICALVLILCACIVCVAWSQPPTNSRPLEVPEGYVVTPFGYFHPSCVLMLAEGQILLADGRVQYADGTVEPSSGMCSYPHYTPSGAIVPADEPASKPNPLTINGWVESVSVTSNASYGKIAATWLVPPSPTSNDGQCLYFFPGFEDSNDVLSIVQPVLQWGGGCYISGGAFWLVASWNCCMSGTTWYSTPLDVSVGDTILGTITPTAKRGRIAPDLERGD